MHYSRALVLVFAGLTFASPSPPRVSLLRKDATIDPSLKLTDHTAHIDLANFEESADESSERSLEKRRNIDICRASPEHFGNCVQMVGIAAVIGIGIASVLKNNSDAKDCTTHTASIDNVHWKVYATGASCDTTAQVRTIQGAVNKYIDKLDGEVCGVHCLKVTHGGTYAGFVTIAPKGTPLDGYYCGHSNRFGNCVSGGEDDA